MKESVVRNQTVPEACQLCALKCYEHKVQVRMPIRLVRNMRPGVFNREMLHALINLCVGRQLKIVGMGPIPSQN